MRHNGRARRWGDDDRYLGPFTWSGNSSYRARGFTLYSGNDEHDGEAGLRLHWGKRVLILALPGWLVRPERAKVQAVGWDEATVARLGRDWYWDVKPREYGVTFSASGGVGEACMVSVHYGRQTHDSSTQQSWTWFLPWTDWRHVRRTLYDAQGATFRHLPERKPPRWLDADQPRLQYEWYRENEVAAEAACSARKFAVLDFDQEPVTATVRIEEREWRAGTGWWRWLGKLRKPIVQRYINIRFDRETGKRKGSWKGGTIEHSGPCKPWQDHKTAFVNYCVQHEMSFVGEID